MSSSAENYDEGSGEHQVESGQNPRELHDECLRGQRAVMAAVRCTERVWTDLVLLPNNDNVHG